jgi:hypothetical protein
MHEDDGTRKGNEQPGHRWKQLANLFAIFLRCGQVGFEHTMVVQEVVYRRVHDQCMAAIMVPTLFEGTELILKVMSPGYGHRVATSLKVRMHSEWLTPAIQNFNGFLSSVVLSRSGQSNDGKESKGNVASTGDSAIPVTQ